MHREGHTTSQLQRMQAPPDALDLLGRMVAFDARQRITAAQALQHRYFTSDPQPTPAASLPPAPVRAGNPLTLEPQVGLVAGPVSCTLRLGVALELMACWHLAHRRCLACAYDLDLLPRRLRTVSLAGCMSRYPLNKVWR